MILDAGVFVLAERNPNLCAAVLKRIRWGRLLTNEAVMAQVWRDPPRQVRLSRFLDDFDVEVEPLANGKAIGALLARAETSDVVDASVAFMAIAREDFVLTSDPKDMEALGAKAVSISP